MTQNIKRPTTTHTVTCTYWSSGRSPGLTSRTSYQPGAGPGRSLNQMVAPTQVSPGVRFQLLCRLSSRPLQPPRHKSSYFDKTIACSMVDGRLDYCNSVLHGTSATNLNKLQRVQNSAAGIVTGSRRSEHALPILAELHWLPIKHRIQYKIAVTVFKVLTTQQPSYCQHHQVSCRFTPTSVLRKESATRRSY